MLKTFVTVVDTGRFILAAKKLNLAQPTVSMHIKCLEDELKVKLIQRNAKKVLITEKGRELYTCANKMIALEKNLLDSWKHEQVKVIKVGASTIPAEYCLPNIIYEFRHKHEDVSFEIVQGDSNNILEYVKEGIVDIGMIGMDYTGADLVCETFAKDRMVIIAPNTIKMRNTSCKTVNDIAKLLINTPFIMREDGSGSRASSVELFENCNINMNDMQIIGHIQNQDTVIRLVRSEIGIAIVSSKAVESEVRQGLLLEFELPNRKAERNLNLVYYKGAIKNTLIKEFVSYVKKYSKN